jgi:chemotaxis protein CheX
MNSSKLAATSGDREAWPALMELAPREVFQLMLGCELTQPAEEAIASPSVTSMVGLAGKLCGVMSVHCDDKAAALMTSKMLGVPLDNVGADISDALGEICNMVAGNFKNKISGLSDGCMLSPPTVVMGSNYSTYAMADSPALQVRVLFEGRPVIISLQIHS